MAGSPCFLDSQPVSLASDATSEAQVMTPNYSPSTITILSTECYGMYHLDFVAMRKGLRLRVGFE